MTMTIMTRNLLLCADLHLTDNSMDEYRWQFMEKILPQLITQRKITTLFILGDIVDRKDRHSGILVNRLVNSLTNIRIEIEQFNRNGNTVFVLKGNHDSPIDEDKQAYWEFLNEVGVKYVSQPLIHEDIALLPYTPNPLRDWQKINYSVSETVFIHQPVDGALTENGYRLQNSSSLPIFPRGMPVYAGDVHRPQQVGNITYIGSPYPIKFGENWDCHRVLIITPDNHYNGYKAPIQIPISGIKRKIISIPETLHVDTANLSWGDQVKIRVQLQPDLLESWPAIEQDIKQQIENTGAVLVGGIEPILFGSGTESEITTTEQNKLESLSPEEILKIFGAEENLSPEIIDIGVQLLKLTN